jgi:DNA-binding NtrC family response regulator
VDSDGASRENLERGLRQASYEVLTVTDAELLERDAEAPVIVLCAQSPVADDRLLDALDAVLSARGRRATVVPPPRSPRSRRLLGQSAEMQRLFKTISQVAPSRISVLISGESGTGKELIAEALHAQSARASGPLLRVSCAALAGGEGESELFGHEPGAIAGGSQLYRGRLERAHGGTLFLDEVAELSPSAQGKLLTFLQTGAFERVGGSDAIEVDVRLLAATERDLPSLVAAGNFREDLFYRLNVVALHAPALRERASDIPLLASALLEQYAEESGSPARHFEEVALVALTSYRWPGNVRELENVVERAVVLARDESVGKELLPAELLEVTTAAETSPPRVPGASMEELERFAILSTLAAHGGSTSQAARTLGISVRKIQYRLRQYAAARGSDVPPRLPSAGVEMSRGGLTPALSARQEDTRSPLKRSGPLP